MNQSIRSRMIKGSAWLTVARSIVNGLGLLSTIILAWYLSPTDYGLVAIGTTLLAILSSVTELSLGAALMHHAAPTRSHYDAIFTLGALRGLILCAIVAACAYPVSVFFEDPRLIEIVLVLSLSLLLGGLNNPYLISLQRQLIFRQEFMISVSQKLSGFLIATAIAIYYQSYWALVVGMLVSQATALIASYAILPFRPRLTFQHFRELFAFSGWLTASQIISTLNWRFDTLLIGKLLGSTQLGYYTVGDRLSSMVTREATLPLTSTVYAGFTNIRDDRNRLAAGYQRIQSLVTAVALPIGVGAAVLAEPLVLLIMGEKWLPIVFIIQALASIFAIQTLGTLAQPLAMSLGETRLIFDREWKLFVMRVPIIGAAIVLFGLPGAVFARVFTGLIGTFVNVLLVRRVTGLSVRKQFFVNLRSITSVSIMALTVIWATDTNTYGFAPPVVELALFAALGGAVYIGCSLFIWQLMKRPPGPETEIMNLVFKVFSRSRSSSPPAS